MGDAIDIFEPAWRFATGALISRLNERARWRNDSEPRSKQNVEAHYGPIQSQRQP